MTSRLKQTIQLLYLSLVAGALVFVLIGQWGKLVEAFANADRILLAASFILCLIAPLLHARAFILSQTAISNRNGVPLRVWLHAFLYSNLGRYVPGKAAVVVGRMLMLQPYGHKPASFVASAIVETGFIVLAGCCLSLLVLPAILPPPLGSWHGTLFATFAVLLCMGLVLASPFVTIVLHRLRRIFRLEALEPSVHFTSRVRLEIFGATGGYLLICGIAYALLIAALGKEPLASFGVVAVGSYGLGVAAGIASLFAPGGIGVREAIAVAPMQQYVPLTTAATAALTLRLLLLLAEVLLALAAFLAFHAAKRPEALAQDQLDLSSEPGVR